MIRFLKDKRDRIIELWLEGDSRDLIAKKLRMSGEPVSRRISPPISSYVLCNSLRLNPHHAPFIEHVQRSMLNLHATATPHFKAKLIANAECARKFLLAVKILTITILAQFLISDKRMKILTKASARCGCDNAPEFTNA